MLPEFTEDILDAVEDGATSWSTAKMKAGTGLVTSMGKETDMEELRIDTKDWNFSEYLDEEGVYVFHKRLNYSGMCSGCGTELYAHNTAKDRYDADGNAICVKCAKTV